MRARSPGPTATGERRPPAAAARRACGSRAAAAPGDGLAQDALDAAVGEDDAGADARHHPRRARVVLGEPPEADRRIERHRHGAGEEGAEEGGEEVGAGREDEGDAVAPARRPAPGARRRRPRRAVAHLAPGDPASRARSRSTKRRPPSGRRPAAARRSRSVSAGKLPPHDRDEVAHRLDRQPRPSSSSSTRKRFSTSAARVSRRIESSRRSSTSRISGVSGPSQPRCSRATAAMPARIAALVHGREDDTGGMRPPARANGAPPGVFPVSGRPFSAPAPTPRRGCAPPGAAAFAAVADDRREPGGVDAAAGRAISTTTAR